jgi:phosphoribosylaminoimidazolecarboxamide formyltransferase/IMP cyclohydrolase
VTHGTPLERVETHPRISAAEHWRAVRTPSAIHVDAMKGVRAARRWRALIATSDKRQLLELGRDLHAMGWEIMATRGTAALLRRAAVPVLDVAEVVNAPELLGGRMKTLSLAIFGGLLMRSGRLPDQEEAERWGFSPIDMLVVGFYDLDSSAVVGSGTGNPIDRIDVGGPSMLRAAAKNHEFVIPLIGSDDYGEVVAALEGSDGNPAGVSGSMRRRLAIKAFRAVAAYDRMVADRLDRP